MLSLRWYAARPFRVFSIMLTDAVRGATRFELEKRVPEVCAAPFPPPFVRMSLEWAVLVCLAPFGRDVGGLELSEWFVVMPLVPPALVKNTEDVLRFRV